MVCVLALIRVGGGVVVGGLRMGRRMFLGGRFLAAARAEELHLGPAADGGQNALVVVVLCPGTRLCQILKSMP